MSYRSFFLTAILTTALWSGGLNAFSSLALKAAQPPKSPTNLLVGSEPSDLEGASEQQLAEFYQFINSPDIQHRIRAQSQGEQSVDIREILSLQETLRQLESRAVLFYPLILDDRLELILLTPDRAPLRRTVNVSRAELNQAILQFRQALQDPSQDAVAPAQQLYQWLIQPIAADLTAAQAETILYSPDGALRYIPLAALHDGQQWLIERFNINSITSASLTDFNAVRPSNRRILAAAFTDGDRSVEMGDQTILLRGYPFAEQEVEHIKTLFPETEILLNQAFTPSAFQSQIGNYDTLHLATPIVLSPDHLNDAFILAGNGESIPLNSVKNWNLSHVNLVVLSTCPTVFGSESLGESANGNELFHLSYMLQTAGAKAVITALWDVDDAGTQVLMGQFYAALHQNKPVTVALREAQVALIQGTTSPEIQSKGADAVVEIGPLPNQPRQLSHPYYWAPFLVIGNGF